MSNKELKKQSDYEDKLISTAILIPFVVLMIQYLLIQYLNTLGINIDVIIQTISKIIVSLFYLRAIKYVLKRNKKNFALIYILFFVIILTNFLLFPENIHSLTSLLFDILFISVPTLIYTISIKSYAVFKKVLFKFSDIIFILGLFFLYMMLSDIIMVDNYSMSLGYYLLLPLIINLLRFLKNNRFIYLLFFIVMLITVLLIGSRGPILSLIGFIILYIFINFRNKTIKELRNITIYFLIGGFFLFIYEYVIEKTIKLLALYNIESRTLNLILNDEAGIHLSGRENLYEGSLMLISQKPLLGWGIVGEMNIFDTYAHNVFLEIFISMGIIMGSIVIVIYTYALLSAFLKTNYQSKELFIILITIGFIPLLVSGTYLTSIQFWILSGFILNIYVSNMKF